MNILVWDFSGHWYVIPVDKSKDFAAWTMSDDDIEPEWAKRVNGWFKEYTIE